jgi:hypothetical protein
MSTPERQKTKKRGRWRKKAGRIKDHVTGQYTQK